MRLAAFSSSSYRETINQTLSSQWMDVTPALALLVYQMMYYNDSLLHRSLTTLGRIENQPV